MRMKSLRVKTFVVRKRLKSKQIVIQMHHFIIRLPLEPFGTRQLSKRSNLMQNYFFTWKYNLHRNFCYGNHQQIRILRLRFHSDDNLLCNRPFPGLEFCGKTQFLCGTFKLCGNFVFAQNFRTRKLVEITIFYALDWYVQTMELCQTVQ